MEWCNDGEILAVTGFVRLPNLDCKNELRFYTPDGHLRYSITIPHLVIKSLYTYPFILFYHVINFEHFISAHLFGVLAIIGGSSGGS